MTFYDSLLAKMGSRGSHDLPTNEESKSRGDGVTDESTDVREEYFLARLDKTKAARKSLKQRRLA